MSHLPARRWLAAAAGLAALATGAPGRAAPPAAEVPAAGKAAGSRPPGEDAVALFEFLGEPGTAGEAWNRFFDSLPERPQKAAAAGPAEPAPRVIK